MIKWKIDGKSKSEYFIILLMLLCITYKNSTAYMVKFLNALLVDDAFPSLQLEDPEIK